MRTETITEIVEFDRAAPDYGTEVGFDIKTTEQTITLAIDNDSCCCESWGYFLTEDDTEKFIGAEIRGLALTDMNRSKKAFKTSWDSDDREDAIHLDYGGVMFVDIETDRGNLQFVAYNAQNGYYGHTARISSKQLEHSEIL
jgi:hypothetical protein